MKEKSLKFGLVFEDIFILKLFNRLRIFVQKLREQNILLNYFFYTLVVVWRFDFRAILNILRNLNDGSEFFEFL